MTVQLAVLNFCLRIPFLRECGGARGGRTPPASALYLKLPINRTSGRYVICAVRRCSATGSTGKSETPISLNFRRYVLRSGDP